MTSTTNDDNHNSMDVVFAEIGDFGVFQIVNIILICIPSILSATYMVNYVFAADSLNYRSV